MHGNRRSNIIDMAREKVAQLASVANPPTRQKVLQVAVPETPKPAMSRPVVKGPKAAAESEVS
jgi:hypothetical protein